jgi:hypothetical protein
VPKLIAIIGLTVNAIGVLLLFRFGMPFRIEMKGKNMVVAGQTDSKEVEREQTYRLLGYVGLAAIIFGTLLQIIGVICA